jgi:hypothetical protein
MTLIAHPDSTWKADLGYAGTLQPSYQREQR